MSGSLAFLWQSTKVGRSRYTVGTMNENYSEMFPQLELGEGIVAGDAPEGWTALRACPLLVLVGVTGVGKSTTLARMEEQGARLAALPERRTLTDRLIIPAVQAAAGEAIAPVVDRAARFGYTRRFREMYGGGMAQALTLISVAPEIACQPVLFDGLRGADEIAFALEHLPQARFVMLDAPDVVRVLRLLGRNDSFDRMASGSQAAGGGDPVTLGDLVVDEVGALFSEDEVVRLRALVGSGMVTADEVQAKVRIVLEERRNYDPAATRRLLEEAGGTRALIVETTAHDSSAVAAMIVEACRKWFGSTGTDGA